MRRAWWALLPVLLAAPGLGALDNPPDKPKSETAQSPADQYRALLKDFQSAQEAFSKAYGQAKTDEERQKVFNEKYPQPDRYAKGFLELAEKNPHDPVALDSLIWICTSASYVPEAEKALGILLRDHVQSDKLGTVCQLLAYSQSKSAEPLLRAVLEKNPSRDVQANACLTLARRLKNESEQPSGPLSALQAVLAGKTTSSKNPAEEAEKLFERVVEQYGDVKSFRGTLADAAKSDLFEVRNLGIGKVAPEIEGDDLGGEKFKLSDYRGKVVVLDFWGNW